jgi:hypothetical protein
MHPLPASKTDASHWREIHWGLLIYVPGESVELFSTVTGASFIFNNPDGDAIDQAGYTHYRIISKPVWREMGQGGLCKDVLPVWILTRRAGESEPTIRFVNTAKQLSMYLHRHGTRMFTITHWAPSTGHPDLPPKTQDEWAE